MTDKLGSQDSNGERPNDAKSDAQGPEKKRTWLPITVFFLVILLALILHRCQEESPPPSTTLPPPPIGTGIRHDTVPLPAAPAPVETTTTSTLKPKPVPVAHSKPADTVAVAPKPRVAAPVDSGPYIYADPWGGRHFDSVRVSLHCREGCLVLYSFEDSVHFKSYDQPFVFRRNTTLWLSGIDSLNRQVAPMRVDYVIERNPGACAGNSMPIDIKGKSVCMDIYEWPNRDGEIPRTFVNHKEAADSCHQAGKRLCSQEEWREGCQGPDAAAYPYGGKYNENYCPAKEPAAARAGRFPVCRSYYGMFDMTGNLWEWTSTQVKGDPDFSDFYMVAGGNWDAGNEATCSLAKFSFYPSVRYPFVGFRCCSETARK